MSDIPSKAFQYHRRFPAGKLQVIPSKPCATQEDLALAYSPGVAHPCRAIHDDPAASYTYTMRGNTVAVISNGTAVLGLGDIGPLASLPVMEGKCMLLKRFADINGIPLALQTDTIDSFIAAVAALGPSFGAINLEDIKAPDCFVVEEQLRKRMSIPVFHDDQHGTAIIVLAALMGSSVVVGKPLATMRVVINGAGAAGIAIATLLREAGVDPKQIYVVDRQGVIFTGRTERMNAYKHTFAQQAKARTLAEALVQADVFIGVSQGNILTEAMVRSMNPKAIIFALANPAPEISPRDANRWGAAVVATGRSDYPNQVNNALGFPGIFRATLDVRASQITMGMKLAAAHALHVLTTTPIPKRIQTYLGKIYPKEQSQGTFAAKNPLSAHYIIPKLFDPRLVPTVAAAVAQAAVQEEVALLPLNIRAYRESLQRRLRKI